MRGPKISCGTCVRSWPEVVRSDGLDLRHGPKVFVLVSSEDMCGFEASGLSRRSREHLLERSWVSCSIPIPMKVVNGNGGGR
jgi:hypothetical protein